MLLNRVGIKYGNFEMMLVYKYVGRAKYAIRMGLRKYLHVEIRNVTRRKEHRGCADLLGFQGRHLGRDRGLKRCFGLLLFKLHTSHVMSRGTRPRCV